MRKFFLILIVSFTAVYFVAAQKTKPAKTIITIAFHNMVGDSALQLGNSYHNSFEEEFTVRNFKYYISNIRLLDSNNKVSFNAKNTWLVNEADSVSKHIKLQVNNSAVKKFLFTIGVDSIANTSGIQTGVLDPLKGMFWTWNTGYIMAKLDGTSTASTAPAHYFTYHVGGYKSGEQTARKIELMLPVALNNNTTIINIKADALKWFNGVHQIKISESPICHSPGALAVQLADNYATMFSIAQP